MLEAANARLQDVESLLRKTTIAMDQQEAQELQGEVFAISAMISSYLGQLEQTLTLSEQALQLLPPQSNLLPVVAMSQGMVYKRIGEESQAYAGFLKARELSRVKNRHVEMISIANIGVSLQKRGQLHDAVNIYKQALYQNQHDQITPASCMAYLGLGEIYREWNDLESAIHYLQQGQEFARLWGYAGAIADISIALSQVQLAQDRKSDVLASLEGAEALTRKNQDPFVLAQLQVFRTLVLLMRGDLEAALRWEREVDMNITLRNDAGRILMHYLLQARLELARGEFQQALTILEHLLSNEQAHSRMTNIVKILLLQALTYQQQQKIQLALTKLAQALAYAEAENFIRIFVDEGLPLARLLLNLRKLDQPRRHSLKYVVSLSYIDKLLSLMEREHPWIETQKGSPVRELFSVSLSKRELEILRLMAEGYSNTDIAAQLVVALSTVKSHVNTIYRKLQVENRTQAIARARSTHLLSD
jgi:LuxR family maltose regulon positive regulatory protein